MMVVVYLDTWVPYSKLSDMEADPHLFHQYFRPFLRLEHEVTAGEG
jgi:hypothetical protein